MKNNEHIIGEAVRIESNDIDGKLYIVFEVIDPQAKLDIRKNWIESIEYRIVDRKLILSKD